MRRIHYPSYYIRKYLDKLRIYLYNRDAYLGLDELNKLTCQQIKRRLKGIGRDQLAWWYARRNKYPIPPIEDSIREAIGLLKIKPSNCRIKLGIEGGKIVKLPVLSMSEDQWFPIIISRDGVIRMSWDKYGEKIKVKRWQRKRS